MLPYSATGGGRMHHKLFARLLSQPVYATEGLRFKLPRSIKNSTRLGATFMARSTEKDITGFLEKTACDKAFSDIFYIFYRSV